MDGWINGAQSFGFLPQLFSVNSINPIYRKDIKTVTKKPKYLLMLHFSFLYLLLEELVTKMIKKQAVC